MSNEIKILWLLLRVFLNLLIFERFKWVTNNCIIEFIFIFITVLFLFMH
jgi:hypothetical protein